MFDQQEHDPLRELLGRIDLPSEDPSRREAIFAGTRGVLRTRRIVRRAYWGMGFVGCYLLGAFSVIGWQAVNSERGVVIRSEPVAEQAQERTPTQELEPASDVVADPVSESSMEAGPLTATEAGPPQIETPQPTEVLTTFEKLRRAGDRQLNERGNLRGAILCYRRALEFAVDEELAVVPDRDSWLLISLKESHSQERKHVHKKS